MSRWEPNSNDTLPKNASANASEVTSVARRIVALGESTGDRQLCEGFEKFLRKELSGEGLNNCLMDNFRRHRSMEAYSLIYELNYKHFLQLIFKRVRFYSALLDPKDIAQDVFLSIYRYPDRFRVEKETSFRNWSYSIIRNTILKHLKQKEKAEHSTDFFADILEDRSQADPLEALDHQESLERCHQLYLVYLLLYLKAYDDRLSEREKRALHLVEIENKRYREASEELDIKLENLKMVICRARKKILRAINQMIGAER